MLVLGFRFKNKEMPLLYTWNFTFTFGQPFALKSHFAILIYKNKAVGLIVIQIHQPIKSSALLTNIFSARDISYDRHQNDFDLIFHL